jgi:hypothetical protein
VSSVNEDGSSQEPALARVRTSFLAAAADHRVMQINQFGADHSVPLTISEFRSFAESVWSAEGRTEHLMISEVEQLRTALQIELEDSAAAARWYTIPEWFDGGDSRGPRLVAYIDVKAEGLRRLVALHEIAHLLVDSETTVYGHGPRWVVTYRGLIKKHLPPTVHAMWELAFEEESKAVAKRIVAEPLWLAHLVQE